MVSHIDCITDFIHYRSNFMATKTLFSSIHYGAVATYAPINGLKNYLAIIAPLGNIQANNLTHCAAHAYQSIFSRCEMFSAPLSPFHVTFSAMLLSSRETFSTALNVLNSATPIWLYFVPSGWWCCVLLKLRIGRR